ncbi:AAA family ATPase [Eubacterium aggregans]|uniref:AAA family ATPase n=1 Tax=Eubacterium aggregans TaxID=81409 RepID=UPI003F2E3A3F
MLIKSLRIENFRQFKGSNSIDFSIDPNKNVTIILGDNTFGKTTLLQAFNWCFYGIVTFDHNPKDLLNLEVADEMYNEDTRNVEVELTLLHDGSEYYITRTQRYTMTNGKARGEASPQVKVSYKQPDGQTESVKAMHVNNVINNILPKDLLTYFFFDIERVNSISTRRDVAQAVKGLLGLTILDSTIKHLGSRDTKTSVIGKYYAAMDQDGYNKAHDALTIIQDAQQESASCLEKLEECNSQIQDYEERREELNTILRNNQATSELQKRKETIECYIKTENVTLTSTINSFFREFSQGALSFFAQPLLSTAKAFLTEVKIDDKGVRDLTKPTIEELIKRGRCICGAEICAGNDAYNHLMEELAYVPPESIGNTVRHYKESLNNFSRHANSLYEKLNEQYEAIYRSKNRIQEWEDELLDISSQIKGKENMHQYESDLATVKKRLQKLNEKKEKLSRADQTEKDKIETYKKVYDSLVAVPSKNKEIMTLMEYAEAIREWLETTYAEKEVAIRESLETKVNEIFDRMYHGHRRVVIANKYQVSLLTAIADKEVAAGESEGYNRVKNFAFIAGLVALAKEKIMTDNSENGFDLSSEPYPLVMDAPFPNADEIHTANISKVLPEVAEQVIMFVMQKDWQYAEPVMTDRVGKQYQLNKISETFTKLQSRSICMDIFESDYTISGKHATYLKYLAVKNSKDNANETTSTARIFERYIDVYMNAIV